MRAFSGESTESIFSSRFTISTLAGSVGPIGCFVLLFALISPRLALFFLWLFSDVVVDAFPEWIVPVLGFFLLPWTTLAYAVMWGLSPQGVEGFEWFIVAFAFAVDLGAFAKGGRRAERRA